MTDVLIGFTGGDYAMVLTDTAAARSIVVFKNNEDKILGLDHFKLLGMSGPNGDRNAFGEYVQKNVHLYQLKNNIPLSTHAAANFLRFLTL